VIILCAHIIDSYTYENDTNLANISFSIKKYKLKK